MTSNAPRNESAVSYHRRRAKELQQIRAPWEPVWRSLADFIEPTRLRLDDKREGAFSRKSIIDSKATRAWRTLKSGMHSGLTSPARPWFRLATFDPELRDFAPVKTYLADCETRLRETFSASNIYSAFHVGYGDMGQFGQSCGLLVEDDATSIRMMQLVPGQFWIARDDTGRASTLYRRFSWSVERIIGRFGYNAVSAKIRGQYDRGSYDDAHPIWHAVEPRHDRDASKPDKRNKRFLSNYWEDATDGAPSQGLLEESGFDENPIIAPPWELIGDDFYSSSPGQIALGDVRMLQLQQTRKLEAIDKMVRPPMMGPTSMRGHPSSLLPGEVTYVDDPTGKGFRPAMEVTLRLGELREDINETRRAIEEAFYADLFLMLSNMEGIQPRNQFEIAERKEEKLLALGPVLENIYHGQLAPVIDRTFDILQRNGVLPPPPREVSGHDLHIEYVSILAQAQKAVSTGVIERSMAFVGQLAAVKPEALDKIDADEAVDVYFDLVGTPPSIVVPDDKVRELRDARAQRQQAQENTALAKEGATTAKIGADAASVLADAQNNPSAGALLQSIGIA